MALLRCVLLIFAHFSIRELLEKDVGQVAGGLVQHCIHCAVHVSEYLAPHTTLEEVKVVVQVILTNTRYRTDLPPFQSAASHTQYATQLRKTGDKKE